MKNDPSISACFTAASIINEHGTIYTEQSECDAPLDLYKQQKKSMSEIAKHFFYKGNFLSHSSVLIKKNAFIGAHTIILKGVTVGERSIIGAGSVVTKSIPDDEVWAGNPAKRIRKCGDIE